MHSDKKSLTHPSSQMELPPAYSLVAMTQSGEENVISNIKLLTETEYKTYSEYIGQLTQFSTDEKLFSIVENSLVDLERGLAKHLDGYTNSTHSRAPDLQSISLDINRLALNVLSSIRTYLDHTETKLKRQSENSAQDVQLFKQVTGKAFDEHFAYRFTEKLRNYAQHCGMPTGTISISSDTDDTDKLSVRISRDMLLKNFSSWGTIVKAELEAGPTDFDIIPLFVEKVKLLKQVDSQINKRPLQLLRKPAQELLQLIIETQLAIPVSSPYLLKASGDEDNPTFVLTHFPFEMIGKVTGVNFTFPDDDSLKTGGKVKVE